VKPADAHQVGHAGDAEDLPVVGVDRRLVADGQRCEHAGGPRVVDTPQDVVAQLLAPARDRPRGRRPEEPRTGPHAAAGPEPALEHPQLEVEAVRVAQAVGPPQAHGQLPAVAGHQSLSRRLEQDLAVPARTPGQADPGGHAHGLAAGGRGLDLELEQRARGPATRQPGDHAGQQQVLPLQGRRQGVLQARLRAQVGRRERRHGHQRRQHGRTRQRPGPAGRTTEGQQQQGGREQGPGSDRHTRQRMAGLQLHSGPEQPGQRQCAEVPGAAASSVHRASVGSGASADRPPSEPLRGVPPMSISRRLAELGIELPPRAVPAAAYVPFARTGSLVFLSGHIARRDGKPWVGQLGLTMTTEEGKAAARAVAIDLLGTLQAAVGDLAQVRRIVKVMSLVNSTPTFTEQHLVTNGCSELLVQVFGADIGAHARSAFGVAQIPLGACVEIELIAETA
jgi:enamine deaminase RidA (YjgF/YER057c/UK114 family)